MADGVAAPQLIAFYDSIFVQNCCGFASLSLLVYEYAITFGREVDFFWRRKFTGASLLFFLNRYFPLVVNAVSFVGLAPLSDKGYVFNNRARLAISRHSPVHTMGRSFSALRVFALSGRHWPLAILVFLLAAMPFMINCYTYTFLKSLNDPVFGCEATRYISPSLTKASVPPLSPYAYCSRLTMSTANPFAFALNADPAVTIVSRTCLMASDVLVIITTWAATRNTVNLHGPNRGIGHTFAGTLLRDGTVYFVVLLVLNALHLTFTMLPIVDASLAPVSYITLFTEPITAVLVSRFMLNLQAVNRRAINGDSQRTLTLQIGSVNFERVIGSLGSDVLSVTSSVDFSTDAEETEISSMRD
ncbi:hypothetical protein L226DRAFT_572502 [Lentinus tigrinus ALCF2SS1-7]|uniref:uncharacterized protein n=1 Tax=Lentinus tigrinus ALCF2SS1-7 TaxID=1328758 RepID=UPI00116603EF|nr:hypothetical protein L226DRAFT_572502 [Lentinus tigrinus ALCF2SS1-7]